MKQPKAVKACRDKVAKIFCAVFRHSHLLTNCFGYKYCARCGEQLGDTLAGAPMPSGIGGYFLIGQICDCLECRQAFDSLTWVDKIMCPKAEWPTEQLIRQRNEERRSMGLGKYQRGT